MRVVRSAAAHQRQFAVHHPDGEFILRTCEHSHAHHCIEGAQNPAQGRKKLRELLTVLERQRRLTSKDKGFNVQLNDALSLCRGTKILLTPSLSYEKYAVLTTIRAQR